MLAAFRAEEIRFATRNDPFLEGGAQPDLPAGVELSSVSHVKASRYPTTITRFLKYWVAVVS